MLGVGVAPPQLVLPRSGRAQSSSRQSAGLGAARVHAGRAAARGSVWRLHAVQPPEVKGAASEEPPIDTKVVTRKKRATATVKKPKKVHSLAFAE